MKKRVYLDAVAAHPVRPSARRAFLRALSSYGNPSAPHDEGMHAKTLLEDARARIAREVGAKSDAVIFTSGATESNALAIVGYVKARIRDGAWPEDITVMYSPTQHASVLGAVRETELLGATTRPLPLKGTQIDWNALSVALHEGVALVTLDVICGETGVRFDTRRVRTLIDALPLANRPVFHVDATHVPLIEKMERTRLGADVISFDAQKLGGVRGIGALIAPRTVSLLPLVEGGGQERGLRSGTPSPALASAFATAYSEAVRKRERFVKRATTLMGSLMHELRRLDGVVVLEAPDMAPHIRNVSFLGRDTDYLVALMNEAGYAVSTKSACESDTEGSRVVHAFTHDEARSISTLRISLHEGVTVGDISRFLTALHKALALLNLR